MVFPKSILVMRRNSLLFLLALAACTAGLVPAQAGELRAGAAWVDITPPIGHAMWGYAARRDGPSVGILDRLKARAVVLDAPLTLPSPPGGEGRVRGTRLALVSLDLGRPPTRHVTAAIRARVKDLGVDTVLLVASHTHHGPVLELDDWPSKEKPYTQTLENQLVELIRQAAKNCGPARLGIAARELSLNRNRHSKRAERPVDSEFVVVRVESPEGKCIAHLVNFAAHPTMLPRELHKFSADYPGALCQTVEDGGGGLCLFLQGACGDLSPNPQEKKGHESFGRFLGEQALAVSKDIRCDITELKPQSRQHDFRFGKRVDLSNPFLRAAVSAAFFERLIDFYEREYREAIRPQMTTMLLNERIGIVGVSGEFFAGHALSLKKRARLAHVLFLGYCNDFQQYFPTIEAVAEGGYGTDALTSPAEIGAGEHMMNRALIDLFEMRGQIRAFAAP